MEIIASIGIIHGIMAFDRFDDRVGKAQLLLTLTPEEETRVKEKAMSYRRHNNHDTDEYLLQEARVAVLSQKIFTRLREKYDLQDLDRLDAKHIYQNTLESALHDTAKMFGGFENVRGKRILDIACGSLTSQDEFADNPRLYEPWLCRALWELEAEPVGVDIGNLDGEEFEHHNIDLSVPGALNFFPEKSFDGIHLSKLRTSPAFEDATTEDERHTIRDEIETQATRLLKDDGKKIRDSHWWSI